MLHFTGECTQYTRQPIYITLVSIYNPFNSIMCSCTARASPDMLWRLLSRMTSLVDTTSNLVSGAQQRTPRKWIVLARNAFRVACSMYAILGTYQSNVRVQWNIVEIKRVYKIYTRTTRIQRGVFVHSNWSTRWRSDFSATWFQLLRDRRTTFACDISALRT